MVTMIRASLLLSWWLLALAQAAVWDLELCRSRESHWVGGVGDDDGDGGDDDDNDDGND